MPLNTPDLIPNAISGSEKSNDAAKSINSSKNAASADFQAITDKALSLPGAADSAERSKVSDGFTGMHAAMQEAFAENPELAGQTMAKIESSPMPVTDEAANIALFEEMRTTSQTASDLLGNLSIPT